MIQSIIGKIKSSIGLPVDPEYRKFPVFIGCNDWEDLQNILKVETPQPDGLLFVCLEPVFFFGTGEPVHVPDQFDVNMVWRDDGKYFGINTRVCTADRRDARERRFNAKRADIFRISDDWSGNSLFEKFLRWAMMDHLISHDMSHMQASKPELMLAMRAVLDEMAREMSADGAKILYMVTGSSGDYESYYTQSIAAYEDLNLAIAHANAAKSVNARKSGRNKPGNRISYSIEPIVIRKQLPAKYISDAS